jgi:hypothetical protein
VGSHTEFWRIPTSGGPPEELLRGRSQDAGHFAWSNNGAGIIAAPFFATSLHLEAIEFGSGAGRTLTAGALRDIAPSLSANGDTLAFASGEVGYDIIQVFLDGSAPRDVVATVRNELSPSWTHDGVHFAYVTDRNDSPDIWLRNQADGSARLIAGSRELPGASALFDADISPDGSRVAYRAMGAETTIWISPLSGEPPVRLWDDPAKSGQRGPSWPRGRQLFYLDGSRVMSVDLKLKITLMRIGTQRTRIHSLEMKRTSAPFLRSDVGDGFGEVPAMATKILSVVLALAVGLALRLGQDDGSVLPRALAVPLGILDPDLNDM